MKKAFTLIELLIVVAIIAILAAIAVPNFLEAQTRAKISHEYSNMRTNRVALESYRVDNGQYPPDTANEDQSWAFLTSPIAFLSNIPRSVFPEWRAAAPSNTAVTPGTPGGRPLFWYLYWGGGIGSAAGDSIRRTAYLITCAGPDQWRSNGIGGGNMWVITGSDVRYLQPTEPNTSGVTLVERLYDPSNGTISGGDIAASYLGMHNN